MSRGGYERGARLSKTSRMAYGLSICKICDKRRKSRFPNDLRLKDSNTWDTRHDPAVLLCATSGWLSWPPGREYRGAMSSSPRPRRALAAAVLFGLGLAACGG